MSVKTGKDVEFIRLRPGDSVIIAFAEIRLGGARCIKIQLLRNEFPVSVFNEIVLATMRVEAMPVRNYSQVGRVNSARRRRSRFSLSGHDVTMQLLHLLYIIR